MTDREKMLGSEKVGKLLWKLSAPAVVAMLVGAIYNIVDAIFIGQGVNSLALGALTIAFPIDQITMAVANMVGIGAAAVSSMAIGAGDKERANRAAGNSFLFVALFGILITVLGLVFLDPLLSAFGATPNLMEYARQYAGILLFGAPIYLISISGNNLMRSEGNAKMAMTAMIIGMVMNIFLDPLFIFGFHLGVAGAAWATVISRASAFVFVMVYFLSGKSIFRIRKEHFRPDFAMYGRIFSLGVPAFIRQVSGSIIMIVVNHIMRYYGGSEVMMTIGGKAATGGDVYITLFGVIMRLMMFMFMPVMAVTMGLQPIVGFNFGAKKHRRIIEAVNISVAVSVLFGAVSLAVMELFPGALLAIFITKDASRAQLIALGIPIVRTLFLMTPIIGIQVVSATVFQSVGRAGPSLFLSLLRQVLLYAPLVLIFPLIWGLKGAFWAMPVSDLVSTVVAGLMLAAEMKLFRTHSEKLENMKPEPEPEPIEGFIE